jgi:prepilin-type N-terminal cleavage/methylation domain-containing protein
MLQKLRGSNSKGFTLIELMIVIAIIGILAAIAIPNFIAYRNKAYCSSTESDGQNIAAAIADYFADPSHNTTPTLSDVGGTTLLSPLNTATITGPMNSIQVTVTDGAGRCPSDYRTNNWGGSAFFTVNI